MHFNFDFSAGQILWTLTFAGVLVLLVVLLGRDRARRFPWFTASMVILALRMVANRLLQGRMPPITFSEIFLALSDVASIIAVLVLIEIARRSFKGAGRLAWISWTVVLVAVSGVITAKWGPWPSWQTLTAGSTLSALRAMQLFAQKTELLSDTLTIQLCLLVVLFGRRYGAGFRSHAQQIVIGLSTASMTQLAVRLIWQAIAMHTTIHAQADYEHVMALEEKFYNANNVVYLAVLLWWIAYLWMDEPGSTADATPTMEVSEAAGESATEAGEASSEPESSSASEKTIEG